MSRARRAFDALESGLAPLAPRHPRLAFSAAGALGSLRNRLSRRWPSPEQVQALFPHLDRRSAARVSRSIGGFEARNRLLIARLHRTGLERVRPLVADTPGSSRSFARLSSWGSSTSEPCRPWDAAIERLPGPVLLLRQGSPYAPTPPVHLETTEGDGQRRAAAFRRALVHLSAGGFVVVALDVVPGPGFRVPCLGRTIELARGPFAMARLTGARSCRWRPAGGGAEWRSRWARRSPQTGSPPPDPRPGRAPWPPAPPAGSRGTCWNPPRRSGWVCCVSLLGRSELTPAPGAR